MLLMVLGFSGVTKAADSELIFSSYFGESGGEFKIHDAVVDDIGNQYVAGKVDRNGNYNAIVGKMDESGEVMWIWQSQDRTQDDIAHGIAYDGDNNEVYAVGETHGDNFNTTSGVFEENIYDLDVAGFAVKLDNQGSFEWGSYISDDAPNSGNIVALDVDVHEDDFEIPRPMVAGYTDIDEFPTDAPGDNPYRPDSPCPSTNCQTGFAFLFNDAGGREMATYVGGSDDDKMLAVRSHNITQNNFVFTGYTESSDLQTKAKDEPIEDNLIGSRDVPLVQLDRLGQLEYKTYLGGDASDEGHSIISDDQQNTYLTGKTSSDNTNSHFSENGPFKPDIEGDEDAFLMKIDEVEDGGEFNRHISWSTYYGGDTKDKGLDLALDDHAIYASGQTNSSDFPTSTPTFQDNSQAGTQDGFVFQFNHQGDRRFSSRFGGDNEGSAYGIGVTSCGISIAGYTNSDENENFPLKDAYLDEKPGSSFSGFYAKLVPSLKVLIGPDNEVMDKDPFYYQAQTMSLEVPPAINQYYENFKWYHNGKQVGSNSYYDINSGSINSGDYQVEAEANCNSNIINSSVNGEFKLVGCGLPSEMESLYNYDEEDGPTFSAVPPVYNNEKLYITNDITVDETVEIVDSDVIIDDCVTITIEEPDGKLILDENTQFHGCNDWKGIKVEGDAQNPERSTNDHGHLKVMNGASISDARIGAYSKDGGIIEVIEDGEFRYNHTHISLEDYSYSYDGSSGPFLQGGAFYGLMEDPECSPGTFPTYQDKKKIHFENVEDIKTQGNHFENFGHKNAKNSPIGIDAFNADFLNPEYNNFDGSYEVGIKHKDLDQQAGYHIEENTFNGKMKKGIYVKDQDNVSQFGNASNIRWNEFYGEINQAVVALNSTIEYIQGNEIYSNGEVGVKSKDNERICFDGNTINTGPGSDSHVDTGYISINDIDHGTIDNNTIEGAMLSDENTVGIYIENTIPNYVSSNKIEGWHSALEVYQYSSHDLITIRDNQFLSNDFGLVIAQEKHPNYCNDLNNCNSDYSYDLNISIDCNEFYFNDVGIFGSGDLIDQLEGQTLASNVWWDPSIHPNESTQEDWDILWYNDGNNVVYNWTFDDQHSEPNASSGLNKHDYQLNGLNFPGCCSGNDISNNDIGGTICSQLSTSAKRSLNINDQAAENLALQVYPNPAKDNLIIEAQEKENLAKVRIIDMTGRLVLEKGQLGDNEVEMDIENLSKGAYTVHVTMENGQPNEQKLLKQ